MQLKTGDRERRFTQPPGNVSGCPRELDAAAVLVVKALLSFTSFSVAALTSLTTSMAAAPGLVYRRHKAHELGNEIDSRESAA